MAGLTFKLTVDNTDEIEKVIGEKIKDGLLMCGETIEGYAKDDCPVDTGYLRNSITYGLSGEDVNNESYSDNAGVKDGHYDSPAPSTQSNAVYVGSNVEYAEYVEFKDMSHISGKAHFLRDAGYENVDELKDNFLTIFKSI